jgi:hypothetical protein
VYKNELSRDMRAMTSRVIYGPAGPCIAHDPAPSDDAVALLEAVIGGLSVVCVEGAVCVDTR